MVSRQVTIGWPRYYTVGLLEMPEFSEEKRYAILTLKDFKDHPLHCVLLRGYFGKIAEMVVNNPIKCKETKCMFRGDSYHEFLMTW